MLFHAGMPATAFDPWASWTLATQVQCARGLAAAQLKALQGRRLERLLRHASRHSRFYARTLAGHSLESASLGELPPTRKSQLMAQFDDWVTDPALTLAKVRRFVQDPREIGRPLLGRHIAWESSGSSGEPGIFVQDADAMAVYDALEATRRPTLRPLQRWMDPLWLGERIAFVGATDGHFASTVSMERLRRLNPVLRDRLHSLSFMQPVEQLVRRLNALQPTILTTYPSAALLLGREQEAGRLHLDLKEIWTGGEDLSGAMREQVRRTFGCPVANSYGASEFLALAFECLHGNLHLNTDWAILEPVDEADRSVPAGEVGHTTLLTNLANYVQPLIRYDLGDRVRLHSGHCGCGSPLPVLEVHGRSDDTLLLGRQRSVPVLPLALCTVLESNAELFDFQLVQQSPSSLLLRARSNGQDGRAALLRGRAALTDYLHTLGVDDVRIHCRSSAAGLPVQRSCKSRRVIATEQA